MSFNKYSEFDSSQFGPSPQQLYQHQPKELVERRQSKYYSPILPLANSSDHPHHSGSPARDDREAKTQGSIRACDTCRRKKIKCVSTGPGSICKNCGTNNFACTYNESAKKRGPPKGYKADLNKRLKRLEALLGGLTKDEHAIVESNNDISKIQIATIPAVSPESSSSNSSSTNGWLASQSARPSTLLDRGTRTDESDLSTHHHHLAQNRHATIDSQPRYIDDICVLPFLAEKFNLEDERLTSLIPIKIRRLGKSFVLFEEEADASNGRTLNQLLPEKMGILKPGERVLNVEDWIAKVAGITKNTSDQLFKIYFTYIHPGLPIIDKIELLNQYRGLADDYPPAPLLNAIYGAATRHVEKSQAIGDGNFVLNVFGDNLDGWKIPEGGSEGFYGKLMLYIKGIITPDITSVQAMVIAQNHRAGTENGMPRDWLICAAAVRMAQDLGLQRSSDTLDISENEKETRRRVWWGLYIMDKWAAASTGRPQTIFDEDCDQDYPSESASWEEVMDIPSDGKVDDQQPRFPSLDPSIAKNVKGEHIALYQPFVQIAKLSEILGRILQGLYTPLAKKHSAMYGSDIIVAELDKALSDWRAALPPTLQLTGINFMNLDSSGKTPLISISVLLYLAYCTLLILLHRPFIVRHGESKTNLSESSLSICISAATRCVDVASSLQSRDYILVSWNFVIYYVFTASTILGHAAIYSDSVTSDLAKTQLLKGLHVINSLSRFSPKASELFQVLLQLMRAGDLPIDSSLLDNDTQYITYHQHGGNSTQGNETGHSTPTNIVEATNSNLIDVKDTIMDETTTERPTNSTESDSQSAPNHATQQCQEQPKNTSSNSTLPMDDDWINGLYTSFQNDDFQAPFINTNSHPASDPNSLQQFGLNIEQEFTLISQFCNTNQVSERLPTNQSQQLAQNFLFELPNTGFTTGQKHNTTDFNLVTDKPSSSRSSSSASQKCSQSGDSALPKSDDDLTPAIDDSSFRNRPDNPFWSVPSSMEIDDWNTFLLQQPLSFKND